MRCRPTKAPLSAVGAGVAVAAAVAVAAGVVVADFFFRAWNGERKVRNSISIAFKG